MTLLGNFPSYVLSSLNEGFMYVMGSQFEGHVEVDENLEVKKKKKSTTKQILETSENQRKKNRDAEINQATKISPRDKKLVV